MAWLSPEGLELGRSQSRQLYEAEGEAAAGPGEGSWGQRSQGAGRFGRPGKCPESMMVLVPHLQLTKEH